MEEFTSNFISKSGQLEFRYYSATKLVELTQKDMKKATIEEYLHFIGKLGDCLTENNCGKVLFDTQNLRNYNIDYRSSALTNVRKLLFDRAPFFIIAIVKGPSLFENAGLQVSVSVAKTLSKKFVDGRLFEDRTEALQWLVNLPVPKEFN